MTKGHVNLHQGLRAGEHKQRYRRRHDDDADDELACHDDFVDVDEYWNPWRSASGLDFELHQIWQAALGHAHLPGIEVPDVLLGARDALPAGTAVAAPPQPVAADRLTDALYEHLQRVTARATREDYLTGIELEAAREQVRSAGLRTPALLRWFEERRGPGVLILVLAPFWIRALDSWTPPGDPDLDAMTSALLAHLFVRYPVPVSLYHAWRGDALPELKWASWLVLIGQGASLRRAARRFGWTISSQLVPQLLAAPPELALVDALIWAEIAQRGGGPLEHDSIAGSAAYRCDPTASAGAMPARALAFEPAVDDATGQPAARDDDNEYFNEAPERLNDVQRSFWLATVDWLVRYRDELTDETRRLALNWAMHCHTEDLARAVGEAERFSWRGRTPAAVVERAVAYLRTTELSFHRLAPPLLWTSRGWDWEHRDNTHAWSVRELCSAAQLAEESASMEHCVASYAHRCAQGQSAIFSLSRDGTRQLTLEIHPLTRQIVQARGVRNRPATAAELAVAALWLHRTAPQHG